MRHINQLIFDEYVPSTATVYTTADLNGRLAQYDQLAAQVIVDNYTGTTGSFVLGIDHSCDGRNWLQKSTFDVASTPIVAAPTIAYRFDGNQGIPTLGLVRVWFAFTSAGVQAGHVKIHLTARDNR